MVKHSLIAASSQRLYRRKSASLRATFFTKEQALGPKPPSPTSSYPPSVHAATHATHTGATPSHFNSFFSQLNQTQVKAADLTAPLNGRNKNKHCHICKQFFPYDIRRRHLATHPEWLEQQWAQGGYSAFFATLNWSETLVCDNKDHKHRGSTTLHAFWRHIKNFGCTPVHPVVRAAKELLRDNAIKVEPKAMEKVLVQYGLDVNQFADDFRRPASSYFDAARSASGSASTSAIAKNATGCSIAPARASNGHRRSLLHDLYQSQVGHGLVSFDNTDDFIAPQPTDHGATGPWVPPIFALEQPQHQSQAQAPPQPVYQDHTQTVQFPFQVSDDWFHPQPWNLQQIEPPAPFEADASQPQSFSLPVSRVTSPSAPLDASQSLPVSRVPSPSAPSQHSSPSSQYTSAPSTPPPALADPDVFVSPPTPVISNASLFDEHDPFALFKPQEQEHGSESKTQNQGRRCVPLATLPSFTFIDAYTGERVDVERLAGARDAVGNVIVV